MKRIRKSTKQAICVGGGIILVLLVTFFVIYKIQITQIKTACRLEIESNEQILTDKRRVVFVVKNTLKPGTIIQKKNLSKTVIYSDIPDNQYFGLKDIGNKTLVTLEPDMPILRVMTTKSDVQNSTREQEFTEIKLSTNLKKDDLVDIRIAFPNGESYVVLSKKSINQLALDNNGCYLNLNAEELDRIQSAFVDAYVNKATLYTVKYLEPSIQEASTVNYTPHQQVIDLINKDPNIVHIASKYLSESTRLDLEVRLNVFREALANRQLEEKRQEKLILDEEETTEESNSGTGSLQDEEIEESPDVIGEEITEEGVEYID